MVIPSNVRTILYNLPADVHAYTVRECAEDWYTIFLNAKDSREQNKKSLAHELRHINNNDFDKENVNDVEENNHSYD